MSMIQTNRACGGRFSPDWRGGLAVFALLAFVSVSPGQVSVETIGGGPRVGCGSSSGFAAGDTWTVAQFNQPYATALDSQGDLWIADLKNNDVEEVTLAGNRTSSITFEYAAGSNKHPFTNVIGVAVDSANNLYVLTANNLSEYEDVTESFPDLNLVLPLSLSRFSSAPATALAVVNDANTNIYISFTNGSGGTIIRIPQPYTGSYSTVVNNYAFAPAGLAMREDGRLAVSDTLNDGIYVVATNTGSTPVLVTGGLGPGFVNGAAGFARFNQPHGIAASADGRMVVCDTMNNYLRLIDTNFNTTTLYGTPSNIWTITCCTCDPALYAGWVDGTAGNTTTSASGREPVSVTISSNGTLFVTELYYSLIRSVTGSGLTPVTSIGSISSSTNLPTVITEAATAITGTGATLNAAVDPNGSPATVFFQWGAATNYGNTTTQVTVSNNLAITNVVSSTLTGLQPNTVIYYQAVAYNSGGTSYGGNLLFQTLSIGPNAITLAASNITASSATLNGTVNPDGVTASFYFEWGATTNYGNFTATNLLSSNLESNQSVTALLTGLASGSTNHFQLVAFNSAGTNFGGDLAFVTLAVPPVLSISPAFGYFPECQTITVTSSVSNVYYTEDGSAPTTNSSSVANFTLTTNGNYVGSFQWCNAQVDLSALQIIAVNGTVESQVLTGTSSPTNQLGFVRSPTNGIGSWAFIPIVLDLHSNTVVESLSFRVEVTPIPPNTNMIASLSLLPATSNDFVQMIGAAPGNIPVPFFTSPYTTASNGQGLAVLTDGPGTGLEIENFGVVGLLEFQIPANASTNQSYSLNILLPSGTSGGYTNPVPMAPMPPKTLTVADLPYLVGDSTPHYGYSAEEFGDGVLDDSDVNSVIYASMGIRVPPVNSDAYNAMDAWPQTPTRNGDGLLQYLDWYQIWQRSLDLETPNWIRFWTNDGVLFGVTTTNGLPGDPAVPTEADMAQVSGNGPPPGLVWFCHASIRAGTVTNLSPGIACSLPVYANVLAGYSLAGFQFRAIVSPNGNAPPVGQVLFNPAEGIPSPQFLSGLSANDILSFWTLGAFKNPLQNSNYIGTISFQVPSNAQAGQSYAVHFVGVNGVPDDSTEYTMESFPGYAWVRSAALQPASITSDEWKLHFFGSLTNSLAGDDVDADGDGAPNWQEYLAGTDPTNPGSVFQFGGAGFSTDGASGVALSWLTAPGKTYILESIPALGGGSWTAINTNTGDGYTYQFIQTKYNGNAQFYRILLQP
jgi:hypothetical protein